MSYMYHSMEFAVRSKNYSTISMKGAYHSAKDRGHSIKEACSLLNDGHLSSYYWNKWLDKGDFLSGCIVTIFETLYETYKVSEAYSFDNNKPKVPLRKSWQGHQIAYPPQKNSC